MRTAFLTMTVVALVASSMTAASAFNYASLTRDVGVTVVTDDGAAYMYIQTEDADYACLVTHTGGEFAVNFNGGTGCSARGTGTNTDGVFYFRDVIKITNKGAKDIAALWINMSDAVVMTKGASATGAEVTTAGWSQNNAAGALTMGSVIYVGFKVDTTGVALSTPTKTMTIEARAAI